eukprot:28488_1
MTQQLINNRSSMNSLSFSEWNSLSFSEIDKELKKLKDEPLFNLNNSFEVSLSNLSLSIDEDHSLNNNNNHHLNFGSQRTATDCIHSANNKFPMCSPSFNNFGFNPNIRSTNVNIPLNNININNCNRLNNNVHINQHHSNGFPNLPST